MPGLVAYQLCQGIDHQAPCCTADTRASATRQSQPAPITACSGVALHRRMLCSSCRLTRLAHLHGSLPGPPLSGGHPSAWPPAGTEMGGHGGQCAGEGSHEQLMRHQIRAKWITGAGSSDACSRVQCSVQARRAPPLLEERPVTQDSQQLVPQQPTPNQEHVRVPPPARACSARTRGARRVCRRRQSRRRRGQ